MATQTGPKIPVFTGAADGDTYTPQADRMLRMLQALIQCNVLAIQNDPPVAPANGDTYIVAVGTGAWAGQDKNIAYWTTQDLSNPTGVWEFYTPASGWLVANQADGISYKFDGAAWQAQTVITFDGVQTSILHDPSTGNEVRIFDSSSNFVGTGAAIPFACNFTSTNYRVSVTYADPPVNPGFLSVEYVSNVQFKVHSSSATDGSTFRVIGIEQIPN